MKRLWVVLALVAGVALGYAARDLRLGGVAGQGSDMAPPGPSESTSSTASAQTAGLVGEASPTESDLPKLQTFPAANTLLDYVLPDRALAQLRIDVAEIRDCTSEEDLPAFLSQHVVREMLLRISENARPSFGPLIGALAASAETVHLFFLPPTGEIPAPTLLIAVKWPDVTYEDLRQCLRDPVAADLKDGETYNEPAGQFTMEGVRAPTGNVSYVVTEGSVWICNSRGALGELFTMESLPEPEGAPPSQPLLAHVPPGPVVAMINLRPQPDGSAGPAGALAVLAGLGIDRIAAGWCGNPASLALFGAFRKTPAWVTEWPPLDASDLQASAGGALAVLHASLPPVPGMAYTNSMPVTLESREGQGRTPFPRSGGLSDEGQEALRARWARQRQIQMGPRSQTPSFSAPTAARFLPPGRAISILLALGEEELVVWRVTVRGDSENLLNWRQQIESEPWCKVQDTGTGPRWLAFDGGPLQTDWGVERLLVSQEGGTLTFYSSEESSRLLSPSGGSTGQVVMESSSEETAGRPQLHASVSADLLQLLILGEKASLDPKSPAAANIAALLDVLAGFTSPLTFDLTVLPEGIRARVQAEHQLAAALGPILIASAFFRGGI